MDDTKAVEMHKIAVRYASKKGYSNIADDFAQFAIIKLLEGRKATIAQLLIDYLRAEFGDFRVGEKAPKIMDRKFAKDIDELSKFLADEKEVSISPDYFVDRLTEKERIVFVLYYVWGLTPKEIAYVRGSSADSVSSTLVYINKKLTKEKFDERPKENPTSKEESSYSVRT